MDCTFNSNQRAERAMPSRNFWASSPGFSPDPSANERVTTWARPSQRLRGSLSEPALMRRLSPTLRPATSSACYGRVDPPLPTDKGMANCVARASTIARHRVQELGGVWLIIHFVAGPYEAQSCELRRPGDASEIGRSASQFRFGSAMSRRSSDLWVPSILRERVSPKSRTLSLKPT
jgi:hypothetical protein